MNIRNTIIIGSGPAGWTAALYTARANLNPLIFEGTAPNLPGGQLMLTSEIENFPGFPNGIKGPSLMQLFKKQAINFGTEVKSDNVLDLDLSTKPFTVTSETGEMVKARSIILATGTKHKLLNLSGETELLKRGAGVSVCATCDGAFYKNLRVIVVGGGDTAMEEAQFLTRFARSVVLVHRKNKFKASQILIDRIVKNPKITIKFEEEIQKLLIENQKLIGVCLKQNTIMADGLFIAIGHTPNNQLILNQLKLDSDGYVLTCEKSSKTSIDGVFACGDIQDSNYRQAITAAGSGCQAAMDCERFIANL